MDEFWQKKNPTVLATVGSYTYVQVLENQTRTKIIEAILEDPGIHFNEILRTIQSSAGNLAWHLDILETYKVIFKQRVGQYLVYYPYLEKNPLSKLDMKLRKICLLGKFLLMISHKSGIAR